MHPYIYFLISGFSIALQSRNYELLHHKSRLITEHLLKWQLKFLWKLCQQPTQTLAVAHFTPLFQMNTPSQSTDKPYVSTKPHIQQHRTLKWYSWFGTTVIPILLPKWTAGTCVDTRDPSNKFPEELENAQDDTALAFSHTALQKVPWYQLCHPSCRSACR